MNKGTVFWITGLSGAGKTTIGKALYEKKKVYKDNIVFLDGDLLRDVFGNDLGYSTEDRKQSAHRNANLCKLLSDQGIDVIIATISLFHDCHQWNRSNISNYMEIYLEVPIEELINRDQKGLYSKAICGETEEVLGINLDYETPKCPDLVICNDGKLSVSEIVKIIIQHEKHGG